MHKNRPSICTNYKLINMILLTLLSFLDLVSLIGHNWCFRSCVFSIYLMEKRVEWVLFGILTSTSCGWECLDAFLIHFNSKFRHESDHKNDFMIITGWQISSDHYLCKSFFDINNMRLAILTSKMSSCCNDLIQR